MVFTAKNRQNNSRLRILGMVIGIIMLHIRQDKMVRAVFLKKQSNVLEKTQGILNPNKLPEKAPEFPGSFTPNFPPFFPPTETHRNPCIFASRQFANFLFLPAQSL